MKSAVINRTEVQAIATHICRHTNRYDQQFFNALVVAYSLGQAYAIDAERLILTDDEGCIVDEKDIPARWELIDAFEELQCAGL